MQGFIKNIDFDKKYGFVRVGERDDYFFHFSDTQDWEEMRARYNSGGKIAVEFEPTKGPKGLRAANVSVVENG